MTETVGLREKRMMLPHKEVTEILQRLKDGELGVLSAEDELHALLPTEGEPVEGPMTHTRDDIAERETDPAILSGQLRFMAQTLDGERRACVIEAADALDVQRAEIALLRRSDPSGDVGEQDAAELAKRLTIVADRYEKHGEWTNGTYHDAVMIVKELRQAADILARLRRTPDTEALLKISAPDDYVSEYGEEAGAHFMSGVNACIRALATQDPNAGGEDE